MLSVHIAFKSSSFMFAGTMRNVSMMFNTLMHSWPGPVDARAHDALERVSTLTAKPCRHRLISPFCDVILAAVW